MTQWRPLDGQDQWAAWLAERRHGGDPDQHRQVLADLAPGRRVLDVGCGDGLVAFAAAEAVGSGGEVIFSDISADLLDRCRILAAEAGIVDRCRFVQAPARALAGIEDQSVDAVTVRSVLIYEADKASAFAEFHRALRPGGRLSVFEPINRFDHPEPPERFAGYDVAPVADLVAKVKELYEAIQPAGSDPMLDFDERDLVALAEEAGFAEVHLQLEIDVHPSEPRRWGTIVHSSGNPRIPTLAEAMSEALSPEQAERVAAHLRPLVEQGEGRHRSAVAYLWAVR